MFNQIDPLNLFTGFNLNPIPLEASQSMTTTEYLMAIQAKINEVILIRNDVINDASTYTNQKYNELLNIINDLKTLLNNGNILPDGSIGLEKLRSDFLNQMNNTVINMVHDIASIVWFGINDAGYFYSVIPQNWENIIFDTNQEGNLILKY